MRERQTGSGNVGRGCADVLAQHAAPLQGRGEGSIAPGWGAAMLHPYNGRSRERQTGSGNVGSGCADVIEAARRCWRSMLRRYKGEAKDRSRRAGVQQSCTPTTAVRASAKRGAGTLVAAART